MISVSIIEDDHLVRVNLQTLINAAPGFRCIEVFESCESGISQIVTNPPDVLLMDLGLPGMSGVDGIRLLKKELPTLDVIVLTIHENHEVVFEALCAGATGYLVKTMDIERLLGSIAEVHDGGSPMSTQIARMVVTSFSNSRSETVKNHLTPRETEVLHVLCLGYSYKMIADELSISDETVRQHLKNIYRKLEVHSKSEAVARAFRDGLISRF